MDSCLLVIDVQQSFAHRPYFSEAGLQGYLQAQNRLIEGAAALGLPVLRVLHEDAGVDAADPFSRASGLVRPLQGLQPFEAAHTVHKSRHSALVGTGADVWLVQRGVRRLIVSGIRTEQCCETTARHASDLGWQVTFVPEATMTWDIALPGGGRLGSEAIRERTAAVLRGRFAEVMAVDEALHHARQH